MPAVATGSDLPRSLLNLETGLQEKRTARLRIGIIGVELALEPERKRARDGIVEIVRVEQILDCERPEVTVVLTAESDIHNSMRRNHRLDVELVVVHAAGAHVTHDTVERQIFVPDVP